IKDAQLRLNQWEVDVAYPFILWAQRLLSTGAVTVSDVVAVLKFIESFAVRRLVCGVPTNRMRRVFAQMPKSVDTARFVDSASEYLVANDWPTDALFREGFRNARLYIPGRLARTRLILQALERSFPSKEHVAFEEQITIEHVLPQTLNEAWRESLGPDSSRVQERYLHTIGNLTLTAYNSELGNLPFDSKKARLLESKFNLTDWIVAQPTWGELQINLRADDLAGRALAIWRRPD
ncbi:MAG: HNH endonuclease family protein, partial [Dehalococcoidia bacterium]|nr:HNH endonuclease family protein [Dehalococcoidia bacterium]